MPEIVGEGYRLDKIFVETQGTGNSSGDLRNLKGMRQARPEEVALVVYKDLRLVFEAPEGR